MTTETQRSQCVAGVLTEAPARLPPVVAPGAARSQEGLGEFFYKLSRNKIICQYSLCGLA